MGNAEPWDRTSANRAIMVLATLVAGITAIALAVTPPSTAGAWLAAAGLPALLLVVLTLTRLAPGKLPSWYYLAVPTIGQGLLVLCYSVLDTGVTGPLMFICLATLFAASQLRLTAVLISLAVGSAGAAAVTFAQESTAHALRDLSFALPTYAVLAALLYHRGSEQRALQAELRAQATVDHLTQLSTRAVLDAAGAAAIRGGEAGATALIVLDIDNFKSINDTYGHPAGDEALRHLAALCRRFTRSDAVVARLGGDEIACLMPGCDTAIAAERATRLIEAVRASPVELEDGRRFCISISAGVAHAPVHADSLETLYSAADRALYEAKQTGRDRVVPAGTTH